MRTKLIAAIALGFLTLLFTSVADTDVKTKQGIWKGQEIEYAVGEILVKFKADVVPEAIQALLDKYEATVKEEIADLA